MVDAVNTCERSCERASVYPLQADPSREYSAAELLSQGLDPARAREVVTNQRMMPELLDIAGGVSRPAPDDSWLATQLVSALEVSVLWNNLNSRMRKELPVNPL